MALPFQVEQFWQRKRYKRSRNRRLTRKDFAEIMRKSPTKHEAILWEALRNKRLDGIEFCNQVPLLSFIVDFIAWDYKLIVELDGRDHLYGEKKRRDIIRDRILSSQGYSILRVTNSEVAAQLPAVVESIRSICKRLSAGDRMYPLGPRTSMPISGNASDQTEETIQ